MQCAITVTLLFSSVYLTYITLLCSSFAFALYIWLFYIFGFITSVYVREMQIKATCRSTCASYRTCATLKIKVAGKIHVCFFLPSIGICEIYQYSTKPRAINFFYVIFSSTNSVKFIFTAYFYLQY